MKDSTQRAFICIDEWIGMLLSVYLFETGSKLFWIVCPLWLIAVYAISYPLYWWGQENEGKQAPTPLRPIHRRHRRRRGNRLTGPSGSLSS